MAAKEKLTQHELKMQRLAIAEEALNKEFGKGTVFRLDADKAYVWPSISTGALTLDIALGIGGIPRGRITEIYGSEAAGKSTLCLALVAQAQAAGGIVAYLDSEHALDPGYARTVGVDFESMLLSQPDYGEMALDTVDVLAKTGAVDLIVIDSVASLVPKAELEGTMHDNSMALQARMMSQALRKLAGVISKSDTAVVFVNQIRSKVGVFFGSPETTAGGGSLKYYASVRIDIRREKDLVASGNKVGHIAKVKVVKNKMAPPFQEARFDIYWGKGIDKFGCVVDLAVERGLLLKSGAWYNLPDGTALAQGKVAAGQALASDLDFYDELKRKILNDEDTQP